MKRRRRFLRYIRTLAIAGACLAVFASSAVAGGGRTKPVMAERHAAGPVVYRAGDSASSRVPGSASQPVSEPFVTRTVVDDSGQTPVLILAGSALAIALSGAALVVVRLNRNPVGLH